MESTFSLELFLCPAGEEEVRRVLAQSRLVWGVGVSFEDYFKYHSLIRNHSWAERSFQHLVLLSETGQVLSSCKTYFYQVKLKNRVLRLCGIGAVFTPPEQRRKGYATQMLSALLEELRGEGFDLALLFSDIGTEFYARLGFQLIPKQDPVYLFLEDKLTPLEIKIYQHLPEELWEWQRSYGNRQVFSLVRSNDYFQLLSERISWQRKYLGFSEQRILVSAQERSYLWVDLGRRRLVIRDFACAGNDSEGALRRLLAKARKEFRFKEIYGWLPEEFSRYPFLKLKERRERSRTLMMFSALTPAGKEIFSLSPEQIQYWLADYF